MVESRLPSHCLKLQEVSDDAVGELAVRGSVGRLQLEPDDRRGPVYAGAYAFARTGSQVTIENGRERILRGFRKNRSEWEVLLVDHYEGYLSWADYERNQQLIADNANGKGMMVHGALRQGEALLIADTGSK